MRLHHSMRLLLVAACTYAGIAAAGALPEQYKFIQDAFPDVEVDNVQPSPVAGLLQMTVGSELYYVSEDGKYFISGDIFRLDNRKNLTEVARTENRARALTRLSADDGVIFKAEDEKYVVTVFTDIDCPYCRKLHREMDDYNDFGITVRYLFFPRRGPGSDSWAQAEAVWCAESRTDAMTAAKNGEEVDSEACDATAVAQHYQLGKDLGIAGTPAIFTSEGQLIVGYHTADELIEILGDEG